MQPLVGTGLYPLRQAARLVRAKPRDVRRWLRGYSWKYKDGRSSSAPLWRTQLADAEPVSHAKGSTDPVLGFRDLLELRMVRTFVSHGVSLLIIRRTIDEAEKLFGAYPLSNRRFLTDGRKVFLDALEAVTGVPKLLDVVGHQFVFREVIKPSLYAGIDYDRGAATRWFPMPRRKAVVIDPQVQFGTPILTDSGVPTDALFAAWLAELKDHVAVARAFEVPVPMVKAAVQFEQSLLEPA